MANKKNEPSKSVINLTHEEVEKIKAAARKCASKEFEEWENDPDDGKVLIDHFRTYASSCRSYFEDCQDYFKCWDKYRNQKADKTFDFDESKIDYKQIKNHMDIAYFLSLEEFPKFLMSETCLHTRNWVVSQSKKLGMTSGKILEEAAKKAKDQKETQDAEEWAKKEEKLRSKNEYREKMGLEPVDIEQKKQEWEEQKKLGRFGFVLRMRRNYSDKHTNEILNKHGLDHQENTVENGAPENGGEPPQAETPEM